VSGQCACCGGLSYAVVDLETTGLTPGADAVVEVAIVLADAEGDTEADWHTLVRPWRPVAATHVHGLGAGDLEEAPPFEAVADRLDQLLDCRVLVAHNAGFDEAMLAQEWRRLGQDRRWAAACTREAAAQLGLSGQRLPELMAELGIERAGTGHRAASDAEATALVWWRLLNLARARRVHLPLRSAH
jgi:DNA polymerase III epsilon subunit-like protein